MKDHQEPVLLGIDTGGTYTDAVLFSHAEGIIAKAKALTTRHDLSIGIAGAVDKTLAGYPGNPGDINLVSISTTLATNALVEGKGGSVALVMIGFDEQDMEKAGLREALGGDPVIFIPGGHDVRGEARPLEMDGLAPFLEAHADQVAGFAVAGYFAVRNASHEVAVRDFLRQKTGLPVTCSHELSSRLGGPKRALTTLLNARLVPVIDRLIRACNQHLAQVGIEAPLMVMRGDGTLVDAEFALNRPIETILSGPAASLVGAKYLLGRKDAVVSDIGGTTTDVAILEKGWPRIEPDGARVGGFTTMVEAVAMHTFGLGGDSAVSVEDATATGLRLGPRRQVPVSLLAVHFPQVIDILEQQLKDENPGPHAGRFAMRAAEMADRTGHLKQTEQKIYDRLSDEPQPLKTFLKGAAEGGTLNRLVSRGLAQVSGFTPSDAMHVLGLQDNWNGEAAVLAARLFAHARDRFGNPVAADFRELSRLVKEQLTAQSADVILETCLGEDGISIGPGAEQLLKRALGKQPGFVRFSLALDRPLVGLGASAATYYPAIGEVLGTQCLVPGDADVANAVGAVTSEVRVSGSLSVASSDGGNSLSVLLHDGPKMFANEDEALSFATRILETDIRNMAYHAGTDDARIETSIEIEAPEIEGKRHFVQAVVTMTATGKPRISA